VLTYNLAKLFLHLMYTCKYELNLFDDGQCLVMTDTGLPKQANVKFTQELTSEQCC